MSMQSRLERLEALTAEPEGCAECRARTEGRPVFVIAEPGMPLGARSKKCEGCGAPYEVHCFTLNIGDKRIPDAPPMRALGVI